MKSERKRMTRVIARRAVEWREPGGIWKPAVLEMGTPRHHPAAQSWSCPFRVVGGGDEKVREAWGVDALQALLLATSMLSLNLECGYGDYRWLGGRSRRCGLPDSRKLIR
jgi:hypothetical protein